MNEDIPCIIRTIGLPKKPRGGFGRGINTTTIDKGENGNDRSQCGWIQIMGGGCRKH